MKFGKWCVESWGVISSAPNRLGFLSFIDEVINRDGTKNPVHYVMNWVCGSGKSFDYRIIPAATVSFVASSTKINDPVIRF